MSRRADVGEHRAVGELDQAVDQRLGVDDHVDPLVRGAEQVVSLHQLEALVHQRRRVDRDLAAHRPGGVRQRLLDRHLLELLARAPAERPAAGGDVSRSTAARRAARRAAGAGRCARSRPARSAPPWPPPAPSPSSPPTTSDSLLASARSIPSPSVATVGPSPAEPTSELSTRSAPDSSTSRTRPSAPPSTLSVGPRLAGPRCGVLIGEGDPPARRGRAPAPRAPPRSARRTGPPARAPRCGCTRRAPACRSSRSSRGSAVACAGHAPDDTCGRQRKPGRVARARRDQSGRALRRRRPRCSSRRPPRTAPRRGGRGRRRARRTGHPSPSIRVALDEGLEQVAERREQCHADAEDERVRARQPFLVAPRDPHPEHRAEHPDHQSLHGLVGGDPGASGLRPNIRPPR